MVRALTSIPKFLSKRLLHETLDELIHLKTQEELQSLFQDFFRLQPYLVAFLESKRVELSTSGSYTLYCMAFLFWHTYSKWHQAGLTTISESLIAHCLTKLGKNLSALLEERLSSRNYCIMREQFELPQREANECILSSLFDEDETSEGLKESEKSIIGATLRIALDCLQESHECASQNPPSLNLQEWLH
jgi:hypothetical protein